MKSFHISLMMLLTIHLFSGCYVYASEVQDAFEQYQFFLNHGNKSDLKAIEALRKSAQAGCEEAEFELGMAYALGKYGIPQDYKKSFDWFLRSAEKIMQKRS